MPIFKPSPANAVLHEIRNASEIVSVLPLPQVSPPKLCRSTVVSGSRSVVGVGIDAVGVNRPVLNAADDVTILNSEPGG